MYSELVQYFVYSLGGERFAKTPIGGSAEAVERHGRRVEALRRCEISRYLNVLLMPARAVRQRSGLRLRLLPGKAALAANRQLLVDRIHDGARLLLPCERRRLLCAREHLIMRRLTDAETAGATTRARDAGNTTTDKMMGRPLPCGGFFHRHVRGGALGRKSRLLGDTERVQIPHRIARVLDNGYEFERI